MSNETLLAIPFFTFMGLILERSGMAEDLLDTIGQLFGPIRGGLAYAVIFVGALLAATTGVVAASVISMGLISLPIMLRYGYDRRARHRRHRRLGHAGADHPAEPRADRAGRPARRSGTGRLRSADMYAGALDARACVPRPALVCRVLSCSCVGRSCEPATTGAPAAAASEVAHRCAGWHSCWRRGASSSLMPPLALIFLVLGTIFLGVATPTEGGAMGATGALMMALAQAPAHAGRCCARRWTPTAKLSTFVVFILVGAPSSA